MDRITKFLKRLSLAQRKALLKIIADLKNNQLKSYDIKPLKGFKHIFRLRKGKIRIVFIREKGKIQLVDIAFRKDAY